MAAPPLPKCYWPVTITAGVNDAFQVKRVSDSAQINVTIAAGTYYSFESLRAAVQTALTAAWSNGWAVSLASDNRVSFTGTASFALRFAYVGATGKMVAPLLGFRADAIETGSGTSLVSTHQHANGWYAPDPVADDTEDLPGYDRAVARAIGGQTKAVDFGTVYDRVITLGYLPAVKVYKAAEVLTANKRQAIEWLFDDGWARFRWWPDASVEATWTDYVLSPETAKALVRNRLSPGSPLYSLTLRLWKWVG